MMNNLRKKEGFTLIELMVAVGLFLTVMTIGLGSVLSVIDAGQRAGSLKSVMTNLNYAVEEISRDIKFGSEYYCGVTSASTWTPQNCTGGGNPPQSGITFVASNGIDTTYRLNGTQIERTTDHGNTYLGVTAPEIVIQDLKFYVFGALNSDTSQPRVFMIVRGYAGKKPTNQSSFIIQTSLSQRVLDR